MPEVSGFWGFASAPYLSIIGITVMSSICLTIARSYVTKI